MIVRIAIAALVVLSLVAGCADRKAGDKQTVGALGGAVVGGLLGAQVGGGKGQLAATAAGALLGALVGSEIGRSMDEVDRMKAREAFDQAAQAPMGQTITWDNPNSGNSGTVTPTREGTAARGDYCREFQQEVTIGGKTEQAYGTACRRPDGSWEMMQ
jgi:surface antigen